MPVRRARSSESRPGAATARAPQRRPASGGGGPSSWARGETSRSSTPSAPSWVASRPSGRAIAAQSSAGMTTDSSGSAATGRLAVLRRLVEEARCVRGLPDAEQPGQRRSAPAGSRQGPPQPSGQLAVEGHVRPQAPRSSAGALLLVAVGAAAVGEVLANEAAEAHRSDVVHDRLRHVDDSAVAEAPPIRELAVLGDAEAGVEPADLPNAVGRHAHVARDAKARPLRVGAAVAEGTVHQ